MIPVSVLVFLGRFVRNGQVSFGVTVKTADDVQQRGLAAAGGSQHRDKFVLTELDVNSSECMYRGISGEIILGNSFQSEQSITTFHKLIFRQLMPKYVGSIS